MAKKAVAKGAKPKAHSEAKAESLSPIDRGSSIAASVHLREIFFDDLFARRKPQAFRSSDLSKAHVLAGPEKIDVVRSEDAREFIIRINFVLKAVEAEAAEFSDPDLEIGCRTVLIYQIPNLDGVDEQQLIAFGQTSGVFSAWPYWREFVQSTTYRLSVPQIILPTYRV